MSNDLSIYGYLYCHTNLIDRKKYWGITKTIPKYRWGKNGSGYMNRNIYFGKIIKEVGWENFQHDVVGVFFDKETLENAERFWIKATRSNESEYGYNREDGGYKNVKTFKNLSKYHKEWLLKSPEERRIRRLKRQERERIKEERMWYNIKKKRETKNIRKNNTFKLRITKNTKTLHKKDLKDLLKILKKELNDMNTIIYEDAETQKQCKKELQQRIRDIKLYIKNYIK